MSGKLAEIAGSKALSLYETKTLSVKITLTVDFVMSVVGAMSFSSLAIMMVITNAKTMMTRIMSVVVGVALVGRMATYSKLQDIETSRS